MKTLIYAIGALALTSGIASAAPVTPNTITGYAASAAVAEGVPLNSHRAPVAAAPRFGGSITKTGLVRTMPTDNRSGAPLKHDAEQHWDADQNNG
ncbi:MAG: hypothetical protein ABW275_03835 [Hansschlegelia sp.]